MIVLNEETPRWLREFARYITIKNLLFVYGNVLDLVSFPVQTDGPESIRWTESDLPNFFKRFLSDMGYEVVGWADPVDDLTFSSPEMEDLFHRLESGREIKPKQSEQELAQEQDKRQLAEQGSTCSSPPTSLPRAETPGARRSNAPVDLERTVTRISRVLENIQVPSAFVFNFASRMVCMPDRLSSAEKSLLTKFLKASQLSREVVRPEGRWNNLMVLICEKLNDLPTFLYMNNPRARSIHLELPDRTDRARFIRRYHRHFYKGDVLAEVSSSVTSDFVDLTEGLTNYEMRSLVNLSVKEQIPICDPETKVSNVKRISEMYKYGVTTSEWDKIDTDKLANAEQFIRERIKGQDTAVARVLDIIKRGKIGLAAGETSKSNRPRGVLFFAGPTGVGKTEMAKALTDLLFGQEERLIRFDMSEYAAPNSDQRLLGAPPGYVGYEEGGQLTNAVKKNPFAILLFDEIEKAHGSIFDKFLQILDDGRLTDGKGDTVYFSECIIIFTSNLGTVTRSENNTAVLVTPEMPYDRMRDIVLEEIRNHFNFVLGRPEVLNRFGDNFVVFDFIKPPLDEHIVDLLLAKLGKAILETKKMVLEIEPTARNRFVSFARTHLQHGGRGIRNAVEAALVNPLARILFDQNIPAYTKITVLDLVDNGEDVPTRFELRVQWSPITSPASPNSTQG